jgi:hypothetical protein
MILYPQTKKMLAYTRALIYYFIASKCHVNLIHRSPLPCTCHLDVDADANSFAYNILYNMVKAYFEP